MVKTVEALGVLMNDNYVREAQEHFFFREYMKYIQQSEKSVYLLTEDFVEAADVEKFLGKNFPKIRLAGVAALREEALDADGVANEINGVHPDVILSFLPMPLSMDFLKKEDGQLNAGMWLGMHKNRQRRLLSGSLKKRMDKNKLARSISRYREVEYAYSRKKKN